MGLRSWLLSLTLPTGSLVNIKPWVKETHGQMRAREAEERGLTVLRYNRDGSLISSEPIESDETVWSEY